MKYRTLIRLALAMAAVLTLGACQQITQGPRPLPEQAIGVAQFTQPTHTWDLLAGYIPEGQPKVDEKVLRDLDESFETLLFRQTKRSYISSGASTRCLEMDMRKRNGSTTALETWLDVGRCMKVDLLIVPQILAWKERDGGDMGTFIPSTVTMDIFVIDIVKERVSARYHFEETQENLASNLMNFDKFMERKGKWITARQLAEEGMRTGIKELGL